MVERVENERTIDDILNAKILRTEPDRAKIKWPKRKKWKLPRRRTECQKTQYHPGTKEARLILEQDGRNFLFCESCGIESPTSIHHVDGNPFNNTLENLKILCQMCHARTHGIDEAELIDEYEGIPIVDE